MKYFLIAVIVLGIIGGLCQTPKSTWKHCVENTDTITINDYFISDCFIK